MSNQQHDTLQVRKAPWTAAPINTLKRRLDQAIAEVEEDNQQIRLVLAKKPRSEVIRVPQSIPHTRTTTQSKTTEPHPDDPDWALRQSQKKKANVRVTYAANVHPTRRLTFGHARRTSSNNNTPPPSSSGSIQTQYHHRRISSNTSNFNSSPALGTRRHGLYRPEKRSKRLSLDGPRKNMVLAFEDVLRQTNLQSDPGQRERSRTGAPSLASICLRNVPRAIEQEQKLRDDEDVGEKTDVQAEVMGVLMERPWAGYPKSSHMAEVVRARAVLQVRQAVLRDNIHANELRDLLFCCADHKCYREADSLTEAWFERNTDADDWPGKTYDQSAVLFYQPFDGLKQSSWTSYHYRQLNMMLQAGIIPPLTWTRTSIGALVEDATLCTTIGEEAPKLLLESFRCCMRTAQFQMPEGEEFRQIGHEAPMSEVLSQLIAAAVNTPRLSLVWPVRCAIEGLIRVTEQQYLEPRMLIMASNILLDIINIYPVSTSDQHTTWFCDLATQATGVQLNHVAEMICSTAHDVAFISSPSTTDNVASAHSTTDRTFDFLHDVLEHLLSHDGPSKHKAILRQLVLSTALAFANNSFSPRRVAYARSIESRITGLRRTEEGTATTFFSPDKPATKRWEEGMCEWVSITPAVPKPLPAVSKPVSDFKSLPDFEPVFELKPLSEPEPVPKSKSLPESKLIPESKPLLASESLSQAKRLPEFKSLLASKSTPMIKAPSNFKPLPEFKPLPAIPIDEERWDVSMDMSGNTAPLTPPTSPLAAINIGVENQARLPAVPSFASKSEAKPFSRPKRMLQLDGACDDFDGLPSSSASASASTFVSTYSSNTTQRVDMGRSRDTADSKRPRLTLFERTISEQNTKPLRRVLRKAKSFLTLQNMEGEGDELA